MDELAIDQEFLEEYGDLISKYLWSMKLSGRDEYDDLYNDVVIKLIENKGKYDAKRAAVSTWITWTMRTVVHNYFRHKQQDATHNASSLAEQGHQGDDPMNQEDLPTIISRINNLSNEDRSMLLKYYHLGHTHKEIAEMHRITENAAKTRIHRAKSKLSDDIQGELI